MEKAEIQNLLDIAQSNLNDTKEYKEKGENHNAIRSMRTAYRFTKEAYKGMNLRERAVPIAKLFAIIDKMPLISNGDVHLEMALEQMQEINSEKSSRDS